MKILFAPGSVPYIGKFQGGVYQGYRYGQQLMANKKNGRQRYPKQFYTSDILFRVVKAWSVLTTAEKASWNLWAATYPQPTNQNPAVFLTGYQNYVKTNFYRLLFLGLETPILTEPQLIEISDSIASIQIQNSSGQLLVNYSWSISDNTILSGIFISKVSSDGVSYISSQPYYMGSFGNSQSFEAKFGLLYNGYVVSSALNIAPAGWHVLTRDDYFKILEQIYGGTLPTTISQITGSNQLRTNSLNDWVNTNGTNNFLFNSKGAGVRDDVSGIFANSKSANRIRCSTTTTLGNAIFDIEFNNYINFTRKSGAGYYIKQKEGASIRLVSDASSISPGQFGSMTGNDGKVYTTININGTEIINENLCETKFRDGSVISEVTDNASWASLSTPAMCAPNNDWSKAFIQGDSSINITNAYLQKFGIIPSAGQRLLVTLVKIGATNGQFFDTQQFYVDVV